MCQTSQILFVLSRTYIIDDHVCRKDMIIPSEQKNTHTHTRRDELEKERLVISNLIQTSTKRKKESNPSFLLHPKKNGSSYCHLNGSL